MLTGRKLPFTLAFAVLVVLAFGVSCNGFFVDPTLTSIAVGPSGQNVQQGKTLQMAARGTYDDGTTKNITGSVLWSSSDDTIATVSTSGVLTGVKSGTATITASSGTISGTVTVNVVLTGVTAITVSPTTATVRQGGSQNFTCAATVSGSQPVDITASATWATSDTTNTTITNGQNPAQFGVKSGTANETVTVTVTYTVGSTTFTDTATVTVTQ